MAKAKKPESTHVKMSTHAKNTAKAATPSKSATTAKATTATTAKKPTAGTNSTSSAKPRSTTKAAGSRGPMSLLGGLVDTNLAAQDAARMLLAGTKKQATEKEASGGGGGSVEQIKNDMNKSHGSTMANLLDKAAGPGKRPNLPFTGPGGGKRNDQVGHNQTFGADVNRAGVPRRTPG